jgi:hypothetical protein
MILSAMIAREMNEQSKRIYMVTPPTLRAFQMDIVPPVENGLVRGTILE